MQFIVYRLMEPTTDDIRYIGVTSKALDDRLSCHISAARAGRTDVCCYDWLRSLDEQGLRPRIAVERTFRVRARADAGEQAAIAKYRAEGAPLLNKAAGGPGSLGVRRSAETRKKMGDAKRGVPKTKEHRQNLAKAGGGRAFKDNKGRIFQNIREAGEALGITYQNIWKTLKGKRPTAGGLRFTYLVDVG